MPLRNGRRKAITMNILKLMPPKDARQEVNIFTLTENKSVMCNEKTCACN